MTQRVLIHGKAPISSASALPLETGAWTDIPMQGQFLLDLEFLARHTHPEPYDKVKPTVIAESACVYTTSPPYLMDISRQFPWVHFYAFQHVFMAPGDDEYDPSHPPTLVRITGPSYQTEHNRTMSASEIDSASIQTLSRVKEDSPERRKLVLICHGEDSARQLMLHATLRADFSMLDICGSMPQTYAAGEISLPILIRNNKAFSILVAGSSHATAQYDPTCYMDELCKLDFKPRTVGETKLIISGCDTQVSSNTPYEQVRRTTKTAAIQSFRTTLSVSAGTTKWIQRPSQGSWTA